MRVIIENPDDLHSQAVARARAKRGTLGRFVAGLVRRELKRGPALPPREIRTLNRFPTLSIGRSISVEEAQWLAVEDD